MSMNRGETGFLRFDPPSVCGVWQFDKMYTVHLEHFDKQRMIKITAVSAKVGRSRERDA
jgi:hypothetical protein